MVLVGQPFVIEAEALEDRGLEVIHVDRVLHDVVAEVVGGAEGETGFDAAAEKDRPLPSGFPRFPGAFRPRVLACHAN